MDALDIVLLFFNGGTTTPEDVTFGGEAVTFGGEEVVW